MANPTLAGWGSESTRRQGLRRAGAQGWPPALLLVKPREPRAGKQGDCRAPAQTRAFQPKCPCWPKKRLGFLQGVWEQQLQPPAHLLDGHVSTDASTNAMGCGMTQDRANHRDPSVTMQNGSWLVLPRFMFPTGNRPLVDRTQAITAEPTLGTFLPSVCSSVLLILYL